MASINPKNLSSLAQSLLSLDTDFQELERLGGDIEHTNLDNESGLARARMLMAKFSECGLRIGENLQNFSSHLNEARAKAEKTALSVSEKASLLQARQEQNNSLSQNFQDIVKRMQDLSSKVSTINRGDYSEEEKQELPLKISGLEAELALLIEQMRDMKQRAREQNLKTLEQSADALAQSMLSARKKLSALVGRPLDQSVSERPS